MAVANNLDLTTVRWPSAEARDWAESGLAALCANEHVLAVVAIGSSVRLPESGFDFDCLYVYRGAEPELPPAPMDVDVRGYPAEKIEALIAAGHDLLGWALRLGVLVCERERYWTRLRASWANRLPFPSPDVAEERAERAERLGANLRAVGDEDAAIEQLVAARTHRARAALLRAGVFPASRPELPEQLRSIGATGLALALEEAMEARAALAQSFVREHADTDRYAETDSSRLF
jgi:hypothetical protein